MTPGDWDRPEWDQAQKVHDWKNYATHDLRALWLALTPTTKRIVAECLQEIADREDWD